MLDTKQLKERGIRFGRSLQMALRTSVMFSPDHPSLTRPLEQSFNALNELLKQTGQLTIGFIDNQVIINSVLTNDPGLAQLEKEFLKRGIAAVTFEPGLTLARYRRIIAVISAPASAVEEAGGIREYLELNEIPGARVVAASRNQKKNEQGDTIIETDSEAYILSKQLAEEGPRDFMESLDALLESACIDPSALALSGLNVANPNNVGAGYGVPVPVPNLVIDRDSAPGTGSEQFSGGPASGSTGGGGFGGTGTVGDDSFVGLTPSRTGGGSGPAGSTVQPGGNYVITRPSGAEAHASGAASGSGGYRTFMELVEDSVSRSLVEDKGNPRKSYLALARILKESRLDTVLSFFPQERHDELRTVPPEQLAAEYVEENTLKMIASQMKKAEGSPQNRFVIEEDVLRLLARSLQATHMADRLAFKLAKFIQDFSIPPHLQQKMQDELRWTALSPKQKLSRLMQAARYDYTEFRRFIDYLTELIAQREPEKVVELAAHYFAFLEDDNATIEPEELSRSIDVIRTAKLGREPETASVIERLEKALMRENVTELVHFQVANNLAILAQTASVFEAFDKVLAIAEVLRHSMARDPERHKKCCITGLNRMLSPTSIERLIELYIANRADTSFIKTAATILRHSHPVGSEAVIKHLIEEKTANNRLALMRLIGQIGPSSLEVARRNLRDERWYVVRNMCNLLAELKDPELSSYMGECLRHVEPRVQQAALNALVKTRAERRAALFASSLAELAQVVLDQALDELLYLRAPETVFGLEQFISSERTAPVMARKAIQVLNAVPGNEAAVALDRLANSPTLSEALRQNCRLLVEKRATEPSAPGVAKSAQGPTIH